MPWSTAGPPRRSPPTAITILFSSCYLRLQAYAVLPELSLSEDKGYSRKVTSCRTRVKVTTVFSHGAPKVFPGSFGSLMLHLGLHPCNIAPSLKTNGLGFFVHARTPVSGYAVTTGVPGAERRQHRAYDRHQRIDGAG